MSVLRGLVGANIRRIVRGIRAAVREWGFDVVRYPPPSSLEAFLSEILDLYAIDLVVDVGAHRGEWARAVRALGYEGRIISFEPVEDAYGSLERASRNDPDWDVVNIALGATEQTTTLNVARSRTTSSLLRPSDSYAERYDGAKTVDVQEIRVRRLDEVVGEIVDLRNSSRIYLKIDTQGFDYQVLQGSSKLTQFLVGIQTELSVIPNYEGATPWLEMVAEVMDWGFELAGVFSIDRDRYLRQTEMDGVFLRSELAAFESEN